MIGRCYDPENKSYPNYGGRGIRVCDEWRNDPAAFIATMRPKPPGHTLERIDNNGNYEPGNVRWATRLEQNQNTRTNVIVDAFGFRLCVAEWARRYGLNKWTLHRRIASGWDPEVAIATPARAPGRTYGNQH